MSNSHIAELKRARARIKNKRESFVCIALSRGYIVNQHAVKQIKKWITSQLNDNFNDHDTYGDTLSDWLELRGYNTKIDDGFFWLRECRLRWIDWMIENHTIFEDIIVCNKCNDACR